MRLDRESKTLEYKSKIPAFSTLVKTCVAFANGFGGRILIGIDDKSRDIIGITDHERDRLYDEFPNSLFDSVAPTLVPHIWEKNMNGKSMMIIEIPPSPSKPYYIKTEGIPKGVYIRVGSSTRRASEDYIHDLAREGKRLTFDEETLHESVDILSEDLLKEYYGHKVDRRRLLVDKLIAPYPANSEKYAPTVAGALFFTEQPHDYVAEATILCTRFRGKKGREIIQSEELTGPIHHLAHDCLELVISWLQRDYQLYGAALKGKSLIPEIALREALVNALIHKKYSIPSPIKIAIYDDRCEIFNPGCFPGVIDMSHLGDGTTYLRNPIIGRLAHRMHLVEKLGSGIRLIFESCEAQHIERPLFTEGGDFVKLSFSFQKSDPTSEQHLLRLFGKHQEMTLREISESLGVSKNTAVRRVNKLIECGFVQRLGAGPSVRYVRI